MAKYAEDTTVTVERSKGHLDDLLRKHEAGHILTYEHENQATVSFKIAGRMVKFSLEFSHPSEFSLTEAGRQRTDIQIQKEWEQERKRLWRSLYLVIRAKIESVESGIETEEEAWLAHTMLPDGTTVTDWVSDAVSESYESGQMPTLPNILMLPGSKS